MRTRSDGRVDHRLMAVDRWLSRLRWYDRFPLVVLLALLVVLPDEMMDIFTRNAVDSKQGSTQSSAQGSTRASTQDRFLLPEMVRTTEIYVVACRNAGKPPDIARDVAKGHAVKVAKKYGVPLPKLVTDRLEEQIRKHYRRAPGKNRSMLYSCVVQ